MTTNEKIISALCHQSKDFERLISVFDLVVEKSGMYKTNTYQREKQPVPLKIKLYKNKSQTV